MQYRGDLQSNSFLANIEQSVSPVNDGAGIFFFTQNKEKLVSAKVDISRMFEISKSFKNEIKFGFFYNYFILFVIDIIIFL